MLRLSGMLSKLMQFKYIIYGLGSGRLIPELLCNFRNFLKKLPFQRYLDQISNVFTAIGKNKGSEIKNLLEILKLPSSFSPL